MKTVRLAAAAATTAAAGAFVALPCAFAAPLAPAALPTPARLAALAFPGWTDSTAGRVHSASLPQLPGMAQAAYPGWQADANRVRVEPRLVLRTDATHATLIAGLVPAGADGRSVAAHATPMALAAYQFEHRGNAWRVSGRQGVFALRGFAGGAAVRALALAPGHPAVAVEYGSCWQGYCGTWLAVYEAGPGMVGREPAVELALSGINVDSAPDCQRRLAALLKPHAWDVAARSAGGADPHDCYAIDSSWTIGAAHDVPGDFVIRYHGAISRAGAHAGAADTIDQRQVLRYRNGRYRAVSGFSPVPGI